MHVYEKGSLKSVIAVEFFIFPTVFQKQKVEKELVFHLPKDSR